MLSSRGTFALVATMATLSHAAPTLAPRAGDSKGGLAIADQEPSGAFIKQFYGGQSSLSWWHNWFSNNDHLGSNAGLFIPTIYTDTPYYEDAKLQAGTKYLMGWNEPDIDVPGVAIKINPSSQSAVERWKAVVAHRDRDPSIKIVSPAPAGGAEWLSSFFQTICPGGLDGCALAPDVVAMHGYATSLADFKNKVAKFHDFGRPIWVTEWAAHNWGDGPQPSKAEVSKFMSDTRDWMDGQDYIQRYAWFGAMTSSDMLHNVNENCRLTNADGSITDLGKQYRDGKGPATGTNNIEQPEEVVTATTSTQPPPPPAPTPTPAPVQNNNVVWVTEIETVWVTV